MSSSPIGFTDSTDYDDSYSNLADAKEELRLLEPHSPSDAKDEAKEAKEAKEETREPDYAQFAVIDSDNRDVTVLPTSKVTVTDRIGRHSPLPPLTHSEIRRQEALNEAAEKRGATNFGGKRKKKTKRKIKKIRKKSKKNRSKKPIKK